MSEPKLDGATPDAAGSRPDEVLTEAELNAALEDPELFKRMLEGWRRILLGEFGEIPAAAREKIERAVRKADAQAAIAVVADKLQALIHVIQRPPGSMQGDARLVQCRALVEEITDAFLNVPEPTRSQYLKQFLPVRDRVRALKIDDGESHPA